MGVIFLIRRKTAIVFALMLALSVYVFSVCPVKAVAPHDAVQNWGLIVAGTTGAGDGCRSQEDLQTAEAYSVLLTRSYQADHVYYVHWNTTRPGVDNATSKATVRYAITAWLKARSDSNDVIFMYFLDHGWTTYGETWHFGVGGRTSDKSISGSEFSTWLSQLTYGKLFFVMEACFSGLLIEAISAPNRIVATATDAFTPSANDAQNPPYLPIFSHAFFQSLMQMKSVGNAFNDAYQTVLDRGVNQHPLLDDNGDYVGHAPVPSGGDGTLALSVAWPPGDINGDGAIDIYDVAIIAAAYGCHQGSPNWDQNEWADLNGDYVINSVDLTMAGNNVGYPA